MVSQMFLIALLWGIAGFLAGRMSTQARINQAEAIISTFKMYLVVWSTRGQQSDITKKTEREIERYERAWKK